MSTVKATNGNGSKSPQVAAMIANSMGGTREITDVVEASVIAAYFLQRVGKATAAEIGEKIKERSGVIDEHLLLQAIEALQARGIVSIANGRAAGGLPVKMWRLKRALWAAPPEMAQLVDLLPALVESPESKTLIDAMNAGESDGDGTQKATRKLKYDELHVVDVEFETLDEFFGSQPLSPYLETLLAKSPYRAKGEAALYFWRGRDGALCIPSDVINGFIRTGLRDYGFSDVIGQYLAGTNAYIHPKQPLMLTTLPIISEGKGAGLGIYETLQPGERFRISLRVPTRGMMSLEEFKVWLLAYGPNPLRGLSPARGGRTGKVLLTDFRVVGSCKKDTAALAANNVASLPEHLRAGAEELLRRKI